MKKHFSLILIILILFVFACKTGDKAEITEEGNGIAFQKISLEAAMTQAKAQNKLIYLDFFSPT